MGSATVYIYFGILPSGVGVTQPFGQRWCNSAFWAKANTFFKEIFSKNFLDLIPKSWTINEKISNTKAETKWYFFLQFFFKVFFTISMHAHIYALADASV